MHIINWSSVFVDLESVSLRNEEDTDMTNQQLFRIFKHSVFQLGIFGWGIGQRYVGIENQRHNIGCQREIYQKTKYLPPENKWHWPVWCLRMKDLLNIFSKMVADIFWEVCRNGWEITCLGNETSSQFVLRVSRYTARRSGLKYEKDEDKQKVWLRIWERLK